MLDVTNTTALIQQLATTGLGELRELHNHVADIEKIIRVLIREREAQQRRDERLRARGLHVAEITA
jgi:hypothetical protein